MPNYRRDYTGTYWFFTVVTQRRIPRLVEPVSRACLAQAVRECRERYPFAIDAWVLLPDHMHCVLSLDADRDYSRRWSIIKRRFTQLMRTRGAPCLPWQSRFWAHRIEDKVDFENHVAYVHYNPVKHALVSRVCDWPWSTFQVVSVKLCKKGIVAEVM